MPSKKNKASSIKSKSKKSVKSSKPASKKAAAKKPVAKKAVKVKLKKAAKPAPKKALKTKPVAKKAANGKKVSPPKKTVAVKAKVKKALSPKKTSVKKAVPQAKSKASTKPVAKKPVAKQKAPVKVQPQKPVKAPVKVVAVKKPAAPAPAPKGKTLNNKPVAATAHKPVSKKEEEKPVKIVESVFRKPEKQNYDVLAISNTIPVRQREELPAARIASISNSITNPIKKTDSYAIKPEKEPNGKYELEFVVHCSAEMLYEFLSTPSGLSEWFCDDLNIRNGIYTFIWDDQLQQARLLKTVDLQVVRFQWVDKTDGSYFEFRIQRDDLTNDISLIITDFADTVSERESSKLLWNSQVEKLMHVIGSIF